MKGTKDNIYVSIATTPTFLQKIKILFSKHFFIEGEVGKNIKENKMNLRFK